MDDQHVRRGGDFGHGIEVIVGIVALPDVRKRLAALGFEPIAGTPKEFADRITWEIDKWARVVRAANIKAQ